MKHVYLILPILLVTLVMDGRGGIYFNEHELLTDHKLMLISEKPEFSRLNINTFFLQSIDDDTVILLTDFTGSEKISTLIIDKGSDNEIDLVVDYFFGSNKYKKRKNKSDSRHFKENLAELKRDIISGDIFKLRENFAYKMMSLDMVKEQIEQGTNVKKEGYGYKVRKLDPDTDEIMGEFVFENRFGRYNLLLKTNYYKLYYSKIYPQIRYSVFCLNSKDPVVKETVEALFKEVP